MKRPTYKHPDFVSDTSEKRIENENKRLWLSLTINKDLDETLIVILKNPSRATKDISDKTVFTVTNYVYNNKGDHEVLKNIGKIIILNLIPFYETYSNLLSIKDFSIIDEENLEILKTFTKQHKNVIIAWGNPPAKLHKEYNFLKNKVLEFLKNNQNDVYYVDKLSNLENPKHGQVWGYSNALIRYSL